MTARDSRRRFYYAGSIASAGTVIELSPEESRHLMLVLRLRPGETVEAFDADGRGFLAEVASPAGRGVARLQITEALNVQDADAAQAPSDATTPVINLAVAMLKRRAMDLMIEKLSELGVGTFQPLLTRRCIALGDVRPGEAPPERWDRLAIAAAKQCRRNRPMRALAPLKLRDWLTQGGSVGEGVWPRAAFGHLAPQAPTLGTWLRELTPNQAAEPVWFAIGPEGGWADDEIELLTEAGFAPVNLGDLTLRAETAAIAVAAACRLL